MSELTRTQEEIVARVDALARGEDDFFGFRLEVLVYALDFEHARPFLRDGVTADVWKTTSRESIENDARDYLAFAVGKIVGHRGLSASRSVEKLGEYAWLLGRDDVVAAMDEAGYENYGAPKVRAFAEGMGWSWSVLVSEGDALLLDRMASGLPCVPDCDDGCGR